MTSLLTHALGTTSEKACVLTASAGLAACGVPGGFPGWLGLAQRQPEMDGKNLFGVSRWDNSVIRLLATFGCSIRVPLQLAFRLPGKYCLASSMPRYAEDTAWQAVFSQRALLWLRHAKKLAT